MKTAAHMNRHVVLHADLRRARMQHRGPARGHLDRFLVADLRPQPRPRHPCRVGREHTVDIGADLARLRAKRRRQRRAGDIAAPTSQCRHVVAVVDALKPGHDDHATGSQLRADPGGVDAANSGEAEHPVSANAALQRREGDRRDIAVLQRQTQQRHRNLFAGRQQQIHLSPDRTSRHLVRQAHQVIRRAPHRRQHHHQPGLLRQVELDAVRDRENSLGRRDRRAAVLLYHDRCQRLGLGCHARLLTNPEPAAIRGGPGALSSPICSDS